ncbi:MAG: LytTR family DNA-binding domain-containing protein [Burkholderiaceae bacterium]|jgi:two-component system response regulator AlgR|nr:LytTR family DNA-binding domain-containing protein [Burkholderiaceae bacterium]
MHILIVDDETLARARLHTLLADVAACTGGPTHLVSEAADAQQAMALLQAPGPRPVELVLLDIHMPGQDGLTLARALRRLPLPPAVVFVTAHAGHAVEAFDLDAADYLTKPVRRERLQQALAKAARSAPLQQGVEREAGPVLLIQDRGASMRLPLSEVLYLKAEQKYVTVRTVSRSYIFDGALAELEARHAERLLRVHRNALVARDALRSLERHDDPAEGEGWALRLHGVPELLAVSRRQLPQVRAAMRDQGQPR